MKRILNSLAISTVLLATQHTLPPANPIAPAPVQAQTADELYYTFYNQRIPLAQRTDQIAVVFTPTADSNTRDFNTSTEPGFVQLQQDLLGYPDPSTTRSRTPAATPEPLAVSVQPLGSRYAVIQLPADADAALQAAVQERLQQSYIESTLPVLSRANGEDTIVLPNEILLSFEPDTPQSQVTLTLNRYGLEVVRPLRFSRDRYLVKSRNGDGLAVLAIANQLNGVAGIQAATPNFVQTIAYDTLPSSVAPQPSAGPALNDLLAALPNVNNPTYPSDLWPLLWHMDSTAQRGQIQTRTDIQAPEAWAISRQGAGVTVAVIDSLIQWDHPDLQGNLAAIAPDDPNRLPGEVSGWDFTSDTVVCIDQAGTDCVVGDPDTRISADELAVLRPHLHNTFTLSAVEFAETYESLVQQIRVRASHLSDREVLQSARRYIQNQIAAEFHGTWSAGVVAARPAADLGAVGVAPQAQILPVRVFGLGGEITSASLVEAIGYAAERHVDVINLSLGGLLPDRALTDQIFAVQDAHPDLVIVASAGNDSLDGVAFPAAIPGVVSVGATTLEGRRSPYSTFGAGLDVVAPGGETSFTANQGILTTGGTGLQAFWSGLETPNSRWGVAIDPLGDYVQVQGTSFAAPAVSGVLALMKGEDPQRRLTRDELTNLLAQSANHDGLLVSQADANQYRLQAAIGFDTAGDFPFLRPTGIFPIADPVSAEAYFFGRGLVNARAAVEAVQAQ